MLHNALAVMSSAMPMPPRMMLVMSIVVPMVIAALVVKVIRCGRGCDDYGDEQD